VTWHEMTLAGSFKLPEVIECLLCSRILTGVRGTQVPGRCPDRCQGYAGTPEVPHRYPAGILTGVRGMQNCAHILRHCFLPLGQCAKTYTSTPRFPWCVVRGCLLVPACPICQIRLHPPTSSDDYRSSILI